MDDLNAYSYWPIEWNFGDEPNDGGSGPPTEDPDVIYVVCSIDDEDDTKIEIRLSKAVEDMISGGRLKDGSIAEAHRTNTEAIRDHLRRLADRIDDALAVKPSAAV